MAIHDFKLIGPAAQRAAMEAVWPKVQRVAGESAIFEGTDGLPAQLAERLRTQSLNIAVSEQFTAGLLCLQLASAQAPLGNSEVLSARPETLQQITERAKTFALQAGSALALVVGSLDDEHLHFALHTPKGTYGLQVKFSVTRYALRTRQEVCAMMALNMLRRWLNGWDIAAEHGWVNVVDSLEI